jgi:hypothetical protein
MGIAKQFEAALPFRGFFPSPDDRTLARHWLETELRRRGILRLALQRAEATADPVAIAAHAAALAESETAVVWLGDRLTAWSKPAVRRERAPMTIGRFLTSPLTWLTGGLPRRFED